MNSVIVIAGTTASGKSSLALQLAKKFNTYVINADSRQIYRELKIGTSQPVPDKVIDERCWEIEGVKHYLYGFTSIENDYNIYQYRNDVAQILKSESSVPILAGGTGLYIDSVVFNYDLESSTKNTPLKHLYIYLDIEKEETDRRIKERIGQMFELGLLEENEMLWEKYPGFDLKALKTIGYSEFKEYFEGKTSLEQVREQIFFHTRQYAKRQRTWFRRNKDVRYIKDSKDAAPLVEQFLSGS
jgi:tRNA dimethylallyltransferase